MGCDLNRKTISFYKHIVYASGEKMQRSAELFVGGGWSGVAPESPLIWGGWKEGLPFHFQETYWGGRTKNMLPRIAHVLRIVASIEYIQYRTRKTLGIVTRHPILVTYQIMLFLFEVSSAHSFLLHTLDTWRVTGRNAVDFKHEFANSESFGIYLKSTALRPQISILEPYSLPSHTPERKSCHSIYQTGQPTPSTFLATTSTLAMFVRQLLGL